MGRLAEESASRCFFLGHNRITQLGFELLCVDHVCHHYCKSLPSYKFFKVHENFVDTCIIKSLVPK